MNSKNLGPLTGLLSRLSTAPRECGWVEYKRHRCDPVEIAETLSALSNSAKLADEPSGYICWGVDDETRTVIGTEFDYWASKVGNEDLHAWLARLLTPRMALRVEVGQVDGLKVVVIEIPAANQIPVRFQSFEYVRVGSYCKKLMDYPAIQKNLWDKLRATDFESGVALANCSRATLSNLLDVQSYFGVTKQPSSGDDSDDLLSRFVREEFVRARDHDLWDITNLGALLFARDLANFPTVARKAIRVVIYQGQNKAATAAEHTHTAGYATSFLRVLRDVMNALPTMEQIIGGVRENVPAVPEIAIRELLCNALIHQDLNFSGTGPMVNVFADRTEISNPGNPFVEVLRLMDLPPRSRNDRLAAFMRRIGYCEERGAGITRVFTALEDAHLPAAVFHKVVDSFKAIVSGPQPLSTLSRSDKVQACYWHACLKFVSRERMTNASLRRRLRIADKNYAVATRIITETIESGFVKEYDPTSGKRGKSYVPSWAPSQEGA